MKIRCIAIDDEPLALKQIGAYIEKTPFLENTGLCHNAFEAFEFLSKNETDLMFLDINMPDLNGMDFVKSLKQKPQIIFTTAYSEFAIEGFKVDALDYILKPIDYSSFLKAANKAKTLFELLTRSDETKSSSKGQEIFVKADYKIMRIAVNDIKFIESANEYIKIYTINNEVITTLLRLKNIYEQLPRQKFMRIHRSFIVNLDKIKAVDRNRVMIEPKIYIPVGEQYKEEFQAYVDRNFIS